MPAPPLSDRIAAARARALVQRQLHAPAAAPRSTPGDVAARHRAGAPPWLTEVLQRAEDRLPPAVRAVRWRVGPRAAAGAVLVGVLLAAGLGVLALIGWPGGAVPAGAGGASASQVVPERTGDQGAAGAAPATPGSATPGSATPGPATPGPATPGPALADPATTLVATPTGTVVVHVVGRVLTPGLVTLPAGSRVADALTAAGGAAPEADLAALNLARPLTDGEQVLVPAPGEAPAPVPASPGAAAGAAAGAAVGPLDLNTAGAEQLDALPGVGEVLAARIVAWRQANGRFTSVEDLGEVQGIGPKLLDGVRDLVRV
ncbi:helix-hairpin-helix domain-containing protein [Kineococcus auxinigenes]|uniref:helix-hairpin-helix domain-containing protein n=1 Tax=unclassified Kineococcus TaxID=2621656 RepID=UPI003D7E6947